MLKYFPIFLKKSSKTLPRDSARLGRVRITNFKNLIDLYSMLISYFRGERLMSEKNISVGKKAILSKQSILSPLGGGG